MDRDNPSILKLSSFGNRSCKSGCFDSSFYHCVKAHTGVQHEVIEAVVGPLPVIEATYICSAPPVGRLNFLLSLIGLLRKVFSKPRYFALHGSMHKDVKD